MKVKRGSIENTSNENINETTEKQTNNVTNAVSKKTATTTTSKASTTALSSEKSTTTTTINTSDNKDVKLIEEKEKKSVDSSENSLKQEMDSEDKKPITRSASLGASIQVSIKDDSGEDDVVIAKTEAKEKCEVKIEDEKPTLKTTTSPSVGKAAANRKKRKSIVEDLELSDEEHYNRLKRRKIKVAGAPKLPLTGYVRYMNERREVLRKEHPTKTAIEHTKMISEEWHQLSDDIKGPYINAAAVDKQRYEDELNSFLKANPNVLANELAKNKQNKTKGNDNKSSVLKEKSLSSENLKVPPIKEQKIKTNNHVTRSQSPANNDTFKKTCTPTNGLFKASENCAIYTTNTPGEIPIFTNEFLEHNKVFDLELRTLRKSKQELEQENAVLEKHVENMKVGVKKMTEENNDLQEKNKFLEIYLKKLKKKLASALSGLALPNEPNGATEDNIEVYLEELYKMTTSNTHGPACLNKAKDILRKLDMQIHL